jgi:histidinol-phosphate aminotransferase
MTWVTELARPEIVGFKGYQPAAWEPEFTRLHANELPWRNLGDDTDAGLNRYPEPQPKLLIERLATLYGVSKERLLATRGSDEAIDLLVRAFCRADFDGILICPPTFGMYAVAAQIQGATVHSVPLCAAQGFALDEEAVLEACTAGVKIVFLCSPNNPTGNLLESEAILRIARYLAGRALVVVDEAYVEFSPCESLARYISRHANLCVLRTLSKAHGLAGARCGALLADAEVVKLLKKVIPPYAITQLTVEAVLQLLEPLQLNATGLRIAHIRAERERIAQAVARLPGVQRVWASAANFILAQFANAGEALARARAAQLLVRDMSGYPDLPGALRVTIGTASQNARLLQAWGA